MMPAGAPATPWTLRFGRKSIEKTGQPRLHFGRLSQRSRSPSPHREDATRLRPPTARGADKGAERERRVVKRVVPAVRRPRQLGKLVGDCRLDIGDGIRLGGW